MLYFKWAVLIIGGLIAVSHVFASPYLPVGDEAYIILHRLEAEGIIESGLLTTKPLSIKEIHRLTKEAERNSYAKSIFIEGLVKTLKERFKDEDRGARFIKPIDFFYTGYVYADSDIQALNYNNDGDIYKKGSNGRAGFSSGAELGWFSFYLNPELRYSERDTEAVIKRGYGVLSFLGLDLQIGKDSQWWGPGYHGAILLSNNAEPFMMLKISNPQPVLLPWIFKHLGPLRFVFFATRLEKERHIPEPYLWGMRLNFKPNPYVEIGLQRTALLGGEGYPSNLRTWLKSFTGKGENDPGDPGDQRAGGDLKITLPFQLQPLQIYLEANGEDEAGYLPTKWAHLMGLYLPRILNYERIGFRAEYANTHISGHPNLWYGHGRYAGEAYFYKRRVIGHPMGTDSRNIFMEVSYLIPEGSLSLSYDKEKHNLSGQVKEKKDEVSLQARSKLTKNLGLKASFSYGKIKNIDNMPGEDKKITNIMGFITYRL